MNELNVDEILGISKLKVTVKGKVYLVEDIPLEDFLKPVDESEGVDALRMQVAKALGTSIEDIKPLGIKALMLILTNIRKWLTGEEMVSKVESKKEVSGNP